MKKEQKQELESELEKLISAQSAVEQEPGRHRLVAMKNRSEIKAGIIEYVESLTAESDDDPLFGSLIYDDPRARLRRCIDTDDPDTVYFYHGHYTDADRAECALLECDNGEACETYWHKIQFVDVPEAKE